MAECNVTLNVQGCGIGQPVHCFACGNVVCRACSEIVRLYGKHRRVRICNDCMTDHAEDIARYPAGHFDHNPALTWRLPDSAYEPAPTTGQTEGGIRGS